MIREFACQQPGKPYRLLRWRRSLHAIEEIGDANKARPADATFAHWHHHRAVELTLIQSGKGRRFVADHAEDFGSGDLVVIGPNIPHYWSASTECDGLSLQWHLPPNHGFWEFNDGQALKVLSESRGRGRVVSGETARAVRQMLDAMPALAGGERLACFVGLLARLAGAAQAELRPLASSRFTFPAEAGSQEAIYRAMSYVIAHHRDEVRLGELLRLTGMSRATFARQFRQFTRCSFSDFLNRARLQAVCRDLRESSEPIGTIAFGHGFNHLSLFNRLFRRELGVSPSEYRGGKVSVALPPWTENLFAGLIP